MDQIKIGKFIAARRKQANFTQMQLAEKLNLTDRAVSKWETGKSLPDSSLMPELCEILGITVNDLLSGEVVTMEDYNKELENKLLEIIRQKQAADKRLLSVELVVGVLLIVSMFSLCMVASLVSMADWLRILLIIVGVIPVIIATPFMLKIEQTAGYYECAECGHRYIPTYKSVFLAAHIGTTRRMRCPACGKRSWQKKVLSKD